MKKNCLNLLLILVLALSLTACGGSDGYDNSNDPVNAWEVLADEDLTDDVTAWQGDDGSQLLLDISTPAATPSAPGMAVSERAACSGMNTAWASSTVRSTPTGTIIW